LARVFAKKQMSAAVFTVSKFNHFSFKILKNSEFDKKMLSY
jgi:hypothetical protein